MIALSTLTEVEPITVVPVVVSPSCATTTISFVDDGTSLAGSVATPEPCICQIFLKTICGQKGLEIPKYMLSFITHVEVRIVKTIDLLVQRVVDKTFVHELHILYFNFN